jgi:hypothetical protein
MVYYPKKYYAGLSPTEKKKRLKTILGRIKKNPRDPKTYKSFPTDAGKKVRSSSYTTTFRRVFPNAKSLENKAKISGVPLNIIKTVYNRGLAAWRTGHRPGASQGAWGHARVHSFIVGGKTATTADSDMRREAMRRMNIRKWPIKQFR